MMGWFGATLPEASSHAVRVDLLAAAFSALTAVLTLPVFVLILVFAIRYRRGKAVNREHAPDRNIWLEVSWSVIPFVLILGFFIFSARIFFDLHRPSPSALSINVVARQWMWKFQHPGGQREINELHLPADQPVSLTMASQDVIHSLYVPALRLKQDVVPGQYATLSFTATRPGIYHLHCAEYCGSDHAVMGGRLIVMAPRDYAAWLGHADRATTPAAAGAKLYRQLGCSACHAQGSSVPAPSLAGISGRRVRLTDGSTPIADRQYLHDAILYPNRHVVAGYRPVMPAYARLIDEEQTTALIAWIEVMKEERR